MHVIVGASTLKSIVVSHIEEAHDEVRRLHEGLAPYISLPKLRRLVVEQGDIYDALQAMKPPEELRKVLQILAAMLRPPPREQIRSPADVAALLIIEMGHLDQIVAHNHQGMLRQVRKMFS